MFETVMALFEYTKPYNPEFDGLFFIGHADLWFSQRLMFKTSEHRLNKNNENASTNKEHVRPSQKKVQNMAIKKKAITS